MNFIFIIWSSLPFSWNEIVNCQQEGQLCALIFKYIFCHQFTKPRTETCIFINAKQFQSQIKADMCERIISRRPSDLKFNISTTPALLVLFTMTETPTHATITAEVSKICIYSETPQVATIGAIVDDSRHPIRPVNEQISKLWCESSAKFDGDVYHIEYFANQVSCLKFKVNK